MKTLRFEISGGKTVYLDNVFFKSQHLLFGNPVLDGQEARKDIDTPDFSDPYFIRDDQKPSSAFRTNYLIEKPQYSFSYNDDTKTPNWVSYQLNKSWLGMVNSNSMFQPDPHLPFATQNNAVASDIKNTSNYQKGHLTTRSHRNRNQQDEMTTFLMSNVLPQPLNKPHDQWTKLEDYLRKLANDDQELYIVAGRNGQAIDVSGNPLLLNNKISVPEVVWKVVLVLDSPGQGIYDVDKDTLAFGIYLPNTLDANGKGQDPNDDWTQNFKLNGKTFGLFNVEQLENITGYNFLSNIPTEIQEAIENRTVEDIRAKLSVIEPAPLMAAIDNELPISPVATLFNSTVRHNSLPEQIATATDSRFKGYSVVEVSSNQNGVFKTPDFSTDKTSTSRIHLAQIGSRQISLSQCGPMQVGREQVSIPQNRFYQTCLTEISTEQIGSRQIRPTEIDLFQISSPQINSAQVSTFESRNLTINSVSFTRFADDSQNFNSSKVTLPSFVSSQQLISSDFPNHNFTSNLVSKLNSSALNLWNTLLSPSTPFDINCQITNLPKGQLAEAVVTQFDSFGRPLAGTILIDDDANGVGWFIDPTPFDNSEFTTSLTNTAFRATTGEAVDKYDLLTAILYEMGRLAGLINGHSAFDSHVQTVNGSPSFIGDNFTANLTSDRSHLNSTLYPHDLMNTTLTPGVRKLPSLLDLQILNTVRSTTSLATHPTLQAPLTSAPLVVLLNGDFDLNNPNHPNFGWNRRGAANILNGQAFLSEDSPFLSNFSQTFVIPEGAKTLQFTLIDPQLGQSDLAPPDVLEVALLDANTFKPLVGTTTGLTLTDSFLNLQANGTAYFSPTVKLSGATQSGSQIALSGKRTISIDLTGIASGTSATLYFDLLGFGAKDSHVLIDDVRLIDSCQMAPIAQFDTATTSQNSPLTFNVLANDSDADGTINPSTLQLGITPTHGTLVLNSDNTFTYTSNNGFAGTDRLTYTLQDNQGVLSNEATVTLTVNNLPPQIEAIERENQIIEGTKTVLSAIASDPGSDALTYTWNLGDGTEITGQQIEHTFADNGTYTATLTVTDTHGGSTSQTFDFQVDNVAPSVSAEEDCTLNEGEAIAFNGSYSDLGLNDTHSIHWDFGDGTSVTDTLTPTHTYSQNGTYTVTLTVTDNDGATSSDHLTVTVNNLAPLINQIHKETTLNEGSPATFSAIASDPGNDLLTYTWNFGDGSASVTGQNVTHTYADNGTYTATLTIIDSDGATTTSTLSIEVSNVAPSVNAGEDQSSTEGQTLSFNANFSDPGLNDIHTLTWDFGDGNTAIDTLTPTHTYSQNGTYTVTLSVTDNTGAATTDSFTVTVNNAAPAITSLNAPTEINQGETATFSALANDAGQDTLTYTWDFGDGSNPVIGQSVNHTFTTSGTQPITLTVTDSDGASTTQTRNITVNNVAPTITEIQSESTLNEGSPATFSATASDPGNEPLTYNWNFGDGTNPVTGQTVSHTFVNNGTYTVTLTATDSDGAATTSTLTVEVNNLAPTVNAGEDKTIYADETINFNGSYSDRGLTDTHTITWDFGDGTTVNNFLNLTHHYTTDGTYTVTFTVTDNEGATSSDTLTVSVKKLPTLSLSNVAVTEGDTGNTVTQFTVSLDQASTRLVTVNYTTVEGTAKAGMDYLATSGTLTFTPGQTTQTVSVMIIGDRLSEIDETFTLQLSEAINATLSQSQGVTTIVDNDPLPLLTINDVTLTEGDSGTTLATFTVSLSTASGQTVSVDYNTANGTATALSDYTATSGTLTFAPGQTTQTVSVAVIGDRLSEGNETFMLNLTNPSHATLADAVGMATLNDNDAVSSFYAIRTEGTISINNTADLDGDPLNFNDDARLYAAKGFIFNGNVTLPVQRDAAGNALRNSQGKLLLVDKAVTVASGYQYSTANGSNSQYATLNPPQVVEPQTLTIPAYSETSAQELARRIPTGTPTVYFNISQNPLNSATDWANKFPQPGTATQPRVVRVTNGGLNVPDGVVLNNTVIIVENGDLNFNGSGHRFNNVVLVTNNGSVNLASVQGTDLSVLASGSINMNGGARFAGTTLLTNGNSNGQMNFNGATTTADSSSQLKVIAAGTLNYNANATTRGTLMTTKEFNYNGTSTLFGSIEAKGNITFNGTATVIGLR